MIEQRKHQKMVLNGFFSSSSPKKPLTIENNQLIVGAEKMCLSSIII